MVDVETNDCHIFYILFDASLVTKFNFHSLLNKLIIEIIKHN